MKALVIVFHEKLGAVINCVSEYLMLLLFKNIRNNAIHSEDRILESFRLFQSGSGHFKWIFLEICDGVSGATVKARKHEMGIKLN